MDNRRRLLKWVLAGMVGVTVSGGSVLKVEGAPLTEGNHSERVESLKIKEEAALTAIEDIEVKIDETENEAEKLLGVLKQTAEELSELQGSIDLLSDQIEQRESHLQSQLRAVQVRSGSTNIFSLLLNSDSLGDALGRLDVVNTLFSANQNLIEQQIEDKEAIAETERSLYAKQEEQTLVAAKLENAKVELEENQAEHEVILSQIAVERAEIGEEREALAAQQLENEQELEAVQTSRVEAESTSAIEVTDESEAEVGLSSSADSSQPSTVSTGTIVSIAHSLTGSGYSFSGTTPAGFDCSGFTQYTYQRSGKSIARTAASQFSSSRRLSQSEAQPGDLIFFNQSGSIDHVGIYLGGGRFIGSQTSTGVAVASFTSGYWSNYVAGFGRP